MRKRIVNIFIIVLFAIPIAISMNFCTNHNEEDYFKDDVVVVCDTNDVSFQSQILPVIDNSCLSCHNDANASGGISLEGYDKIKPLSESGVLVKVISHEDGFSPMPQGEDKLPECTINKFRAWFNQGSENN